METILTVLQITAPVFVLAAIGFSWVRFGIEYRMEFITRLTMTLSVPCLIFTALMKADIDPKALADLTLASLASYAAVTAIFAIILAGLGLGQRTFLAPLVFGNTGNLGLPLALFAFGQEGLGLAVVVFAVMAILSFTFGVWVVSGGGSILKVLKEPLVGATLLGALFLWRGWHTPDVITNTLELIGQMAIPLMLMTLGVAVARLEIRGMGRALFLATIKLLITAGLAWLIGGWFDLPSITRAVLVVQLATPVAVTSYFLEEKYGHDGQSVAGLVVVSTLLSVLGLPLVLGVVL